MQPPFHLANVCVKFFKYFFAVSNNKIYNKIYKPTKKWYILVQLLGILRCAKYYRYGYLTSRYCP